MFDPMPDDYNDATEDFPHNFETDQYCPKCGETLYRAPSGRLLCFCSEDVLEILIAEMQAPTDVDESENDWFDDGGWADYFEEEW